MLILLLVTLLVFICIGVIYAGLNMLFYTTEAVVSYNKEVYYDKKR